jgi:hypothetical protein
LRTALTHSQTKKSLGRARPPNGNFPLKHMTTGIAVRSLAFASRCAQAHDTDADTYPRNRLPNSRKAHLDRQVEVELVEQRGARTVAVKVTGQKTNCTGPVTICGHRTPLKPTRSGRLAVTYNERFVSQSPATNDFAVSGELILAAKQIGPYLAY